MSDQTTWENDDVPLKLPVGVHGATTGRWRGAAPGRKSHTVYVKRTILLVGTLGRGIDFYGPFEDGLVAMKWAGENLHAGADVRMEIINVVKE